MVQVSYRQYQIYVFFITYITYAAFYVTRIAWSYSKEYFQEDLQISDRKIGTMDMCFLLCDALPSIFVDKYVQKSELTYLLSFGIILSAISFLSVPIMTLNFIYDHFLIALAISFHGLFQTTLWPGLIGVMGNWFDKKGRGLFMGIWSTNSNFGNIIGLQIGYIFLLQYRLSWEFLFIVAGLLMLFFGVICFFFVKTSPQKAGYQLEQKQRSSQSLQYEIDNSQNKKNELNIGSTKQTIQQKEIQEVNNMWHKKKSEQFKLTFFNAHKVPGVMIYIISYSCLKSANFGLLLWLPKYLDQKGLIQTGAQINQILQVGSFFGGIIIGFISDKLGKRTVIICPVIILAALFMYIFRDLDKTNITMYMIVSFLIGFCLVGCYNLLSAAISIDLAEHPMLRGNNNAITAVSTLIEGVGSMAAAIFQFVIPIFGTRHLFYLFTFMCALSGILLFPMFITDLKEIKNVDNNQKSNKISTNYKLN